MSARYVADMKILDTKKGCFMNFEKERKGEKYDGKTRFKWIVRCEAPPPEQEW